MIPKQLCKDIFRFNKIGDDKRPIELDWQNSRNYNYEEVNFDKYGVVCGYGNLLVIDFDSEEIQNKFFPKLPKTFTVKTAGKGLIHAYFICHEKPKTKRLNDEEGNRIIDIQGEGTYVIGANVVMSNGKQYQVVDDLPIANINYWDLKSIFKDYWDNKKDNDKVRIKSMEGVSQGERDDIAFKKSCSFLSKGLTPEDVLLMLKVWNNNNKPPLTDFELNKCLNSALRYEYPKKQLNTTLPLDNYLQNAETFYDMCPFFYDENKIFWKWNFDLYKYEMVDETDIMNDLDGRLRFEGQTIGNRVKSNYMEALKRVGRSKKPKSSPSKWIQFRGKAYSLNSEKIYDVTPEYFFTNPIKWEIGKSEETPFIDKLFIDWVGKNNKKVLYQIIAYCCYREYPIHRIFCLIGTGRNGKTQYQKLMDIFFGDDNVCSAELDDLMNNRFEQFSLFKKLVCLMGETNFGTMNRTTRLKKLSGQDKVSFEKKGVQSFHGYNYAKLIVNSNSLPPSNDTSDGFYRRWLQIRFPNEFEEGRDIIKEIPDIEFNNLAFKVCRILKELLKNRKFHNEGSIDKRKEDYIMASNPLSLFIRDFCIVDDKEYVSYSELYTKYKGYLTANKIRAVNKGEFRKALENEGLWVERTSKKKDVEFISANWVIGLKINEEKCKKCNYVTTSLLNLNIGDRVEVLTQDTLIHNDKLPEIIAHKCNICGNDTSHYWTEKGKPICKVCNEFREK